MFVWVANHPDHNSSRIGDFAEYDGKMTYSAGMTGNIYICRSHIRRKVVGT
jgi:hypothetical protein